MRRRPAVPRIAEKDVPPGRLSPARLAAGRNVRAAGGPPVLSGRRAKRACPSGTTALSIALRASAQHPSAVAARTGM